LCKVLNFFLYIRLAGIVYTGTRVAFCGAALIANNLIITAAHCIKQSNGKVFTLNELEVVLHAHLMDLTTFGHANYSVGFG